MASFRLAATAGAFLLLLQGCGSDAPAPAKAKPAPPPRPAAAAADARPVEAVAPPAEDEPEFAYDAEDLRDPFEPFIKLQPKKKKPEQPKVFVPKTPLQRYAVEELRLVGVVWAGQGRSTALIEDPEGKGYVVRSGALVGDRGGKITGIHPERVVIEERFVDLFGDENVNTVEMALHKPEGEVTP